MWVVKALLVGVGVAIVVGLSVVALELAAMVLDVATPFLDMVTTGSGGLGAVSVGFSESALCLAVIAGVIGFAFSLRRQIKRRLMARTPTRP
jgi:hypothetical protein